MKKITQCICFTLFATGVTHAQQIDFEQVIPTGTPDISSFHPLSGGSIAFADIDGDNDQDVLMTGWDGSNQVSKLYTNENGTGVFTEVVGTPFPNVSSSAIAFADIDGDNDQDVLITGYDGSVVLSKLYTNNGAGVFTEVITPFAAVNDGFVAFADIDGDADQDVLITGNDASNRIAKLYTNNGAGVFTEVTTPFTAVNSSTIAFADVDGDADQDVLITGNDGTNNISKLYTNNGAGVFMEVTGTPFPGVSSSGSIAFADIDGDADQDVLITGWDGSSQVAKLYTNNSAGIFTEVIGAPFTEISASSIAFADIDGDADQDVLITGWDNSNIISELYTNNGSGIFTEVTGAPFTGVELAAIAFADIDGDADQDVLITGNSDGGRIAKLYTNNGTGDFSEITAYPFDAVYEGSIAFADIDGDADQDVLITGHDGSTRIAKLYTNNGLGGYTEAMGTPFTGVSHGSIVFTDIDGDTDQDVLITGYDDSIATSKLYTNNGAGIFTEVISPFTGVYHSSIAFADIDGDADQDVLITGHNGTNPISKLYINNGTGGFAEVISPFTAVYFSSIAFADVDGDADQDVLITGHNGTNPISKLYINNGAGVFTEVISTPFTNIYYSSIAFTDIDGDADQDVLITGHDGSVVISKLYTNNSAGVFTEVIGVPFTEVSTSSIAFADVDQDADQDVLITGHDGSVVISKLYTNNGAGVFTEVITPFTGVHNSSIAFADIDGDADQDVLITGNDGLIRISKLYKNITCLTTMSSIETSSCHSYTTPSGIVKTVSEVFNDTITNAGGCDSVIAINLTIETIDLNVSINGFTLAADQNGATYQWLTCPDFEPVSGATVQDYLAVANGDYAVQISYNNCMDTTACFEIAGIGIDELDQTLFTILPNPFDEQIKIEFVDGITTGEVRLVNTLGQLIKQANVNEKELIINTKEVASGSYFLILNLDGELKTVKLIKE